MQTKVIENSQNYIMSKMKAGGANPDEDTELNRHIEQQLQNDAEETEREMVVEVNNGHSSSEKESTGHYIKHAVNSNLAKINNINVA